MHAAVPAARVSEPAEVRVAPAARTRSPHGLVRVAVATRTRLPRSLVRGALAAGRDRHRRTVWLRVAVAAGRDRRTVWVRRPAGVVLASSIAVRDGTEASVFAVIPGIAGVGVDTHGGPTNRCRPSGRTTVCVRWQEWCPLPAARWRITIAKTAGPAGVVRVRLEVGQPPGG